MLRRAADAGGRDALAAFGLSQPSLGSVGIKAPTTPKIPGLPSLKPPSVPTTPSAPGGEGGGLGAAAAKNAMLRPTHPAVRNSAVNATQPGAPPAMMKAPPTAPLDPPTLARQFNDAEQNLTRIEPQRKLSAAGICTTCRKEKHYGSCKRPIAIKRSDFNMGMRGDDPTSNDKPATSPHYISATATPPEGRPADEMAQTMFAHLIRPGRVDMMSDEMKLSMFIRTKMRDGDEVASVWRSFDRTSDAASVEGGAGEPSGEPAW